jgi:hypothetical protein
MIMIMIPPFSATGGREVEREGKGEPRGNECYMHSASLAQRVWRENKVDKHRK